MRTYICRECEETVTVGHPGKAFRRKAKGLAAESEGWLKRVLRPLKTRRRYSDAMEERYYLQEGCYRELPPGCPQCGYRGVDELSWWRPGVDLGE